MNAGKPTDLGSIIKLLVQRISSATGISSAYIFPTLSEEWFEPGGMSDKYVMISNFAGSEVPSVTDGAGVAGKIWNATCDVCMVARLDTDSAGKDINRLADTTNGVLESWSALLKALDQWFPDDEGTPPWGLLVQPARTQGFTVRPRNFRGSGGWAMVRTRLHIPFMQNLS